MRKQHVEVHHHPKSGSASFGGLMRCGSVWHCPCCASKVGERRREEIKEAVAEWERRGGRVVMVTYTVRHERGDDLSQLMAGFLLARKKMRSGRWQSSWSSDIGLAGSIRAWEVTHGGNGWHPHIHELLFIADGVQLADLEARMQDRWLQCVQRAGLKAVREVALKVNFDLTGGEYLAKFGRDRQWSEGHELTRSHTKRARGGGRSPWQLLAEWADEEDVRSGALFQQYAAAFKGQRQIRWTNGLKALLLIADKTDEELAEEETEEGVVLVRIRRPGWCWILGNDARGDLLDAAATGDVEQVRGLLHRLTVPDEWWSIPSDFEEVPQCELSSL